METSLRLNIQNSMKNQSITVRDIVYIALMIALIEVCKSALLFLPNIELTSFWIIMFMLFYGRKTYIIIPAFILVEGCLYGFGLWWIMYLYAWPLLGIVTWIFRKQDYALFWSVVSSVFGLIFGFLCSFPYFFIGLTSGGIRSGLVTQFSWWVAGIPWDIAHGVGNFVLMFVLYKPVSKVMRKIFRNEIYMEL